MYPLYIGGFYALYGYGWNGAIDEVRLYNRALSSAEVAELFGPGGKGLIGYWAFDEGSGTVAHDTSGGGHDGAVNAAYWTPGKINFALSFNGDGRSFDEIV